MSQELRELSAAERAELEEKLSGAEEVMDKKLPSELNPLQTLIQRAKLSGAWLAENMPSLASDIGEAQALEGGRKRLQEMSRSLPGMAPEPQREAGFGIEAPDRDTER